MKKLLTLALALAISAPAFAQKMGGTNRNAPKLMQSLTAGEAKMTLNYTSITWAQGQMMERLADKENGGRAREYVNQNAASAPLAEFTTSIDCTVGDLKLAAGSYKVFYTIDDDANWHINFMGKDAKKPMKHKLDLMNSEKKSKRLMMCLYAADKGAGVYIAFGNQTGMLNFAPAKS